MQEEIKEILDNVKKCCDITKDQSFTVYQRQDILALLDYITNLQEKYNKELELLVDFNVPCEIDDFNLLDTDYCELNCSVDDEQYKKCWNKFIEWRLQGVGKE